MNERLKALRRYRILDTAREDSFDELVVEAARKCGTPIALISLVDNHRQWFKAEVGMGVRETDLTSSICSKAIEYEGVFVVPDTRVDPRVNCNPLVTGEANIKFYAGAPLMTPDGYALGTVCVLDHSPRPAGLSSEESSALSRLADTVMKRLEARIAGTNEGKGSNGLSDGHG